MLFIGGWAVTCSVEQTQQHAEVLGPSLSSPPVKVGSFMSGGQVLQESLLLPPFLSLTIYWEKKKEKMENGF